MRIAVFSDLHLEFGSSYEPGDDFDADVVVLAGDIQVPGHLTPAWARQTFGDRPIVYVSGNHELYGQVLQTEEELIREQSDAHGVHWLQCNEVVIKGVRFLGCTLWTDLSLPILDSATGTLRSDNQRAASESADRLSDFDVISFRQRFHRGWSNGTAHRPNHFRPADMVRIHHAHRRWLIAALAKPFSGPTVVVTHHAPSVASVVERWRDDWLSACYASQLPRRCFRVPRLWVHGHTHTSHDYRIGPCRVVCNPRGYPMQRDAPSKEFQNRAWSAVGCGVEV